MGNVGAESSLPPLFSLPPVQQTVRPPLYDVIHDFDAPPLIFQMGVPADDALTGKVWSRLLNRLTREMASRPASYPDPLAACVCASSWSAIWR
ncbi:hypothetical protein [Pantoea sp. BAV 3049]|uniref:hypothetical protein n=1 Tax=Pantoea sp. BAV 3049 TaxID=2654188 RepID=UPI0018EF2197|nr:hypothetical protein [Pantoea sp. BAV 3049]